MPENIPTYLTSPKTTLDFQFSKLFYDAAHPMLIYNLLTETLVDANEATIKELGYSKSELLKITRQDFTPKYSPLVPGVDIHEAFLQKHTKKILKGEKFSEVGVFNRQDGTQLMAKVSFIPTEREKGEAFITLKNITKSVEEKKAQQDKEAQYKSMIETIKAGITIIDLKGNHIYASPQTKELLGYEPKEVLNKKASHFFRKSEEKNLIQYSKDLLKGVKRGSIVYEAVHKKGHSVWVEGTASLVRDSLGNIKGVQTTFIDVSDRVKLERALENINKKLIKERGLLEALIANSKDQIMVGDQNGKIIILNKSYQDHIKKHYGISIKIGDHTQTITEVVFPTQKAKKSWSAKKEKVSSGKTIDLSYEKVDPITKERQYFSLLMSPLFIDKHQPVGIIEITRNITKLKKIEQTILEKNKELQRYIDSNIQLENFAYVASHDLKQPLSTILSFSNLLQIKKADLLDEEANVFLDFIINSAGRLELLIKDMLAYSVIGTTEQFETIDLPSLVNNVIQDLNAQIREKQAIIKIESLPKHIVGYKAEINSLFQNIISNAIKYSKLDVQPKVTLSHEGTGKNWKFIITDNGKGMDTQGIKKIFGMFQRLENNHNNPGSGIGLAHCKKIVEVHQGEIWVESTPNVGSTFYFTIAKDLSA